MDVFSFLPLHEDIFDEIEQICLHPLALGHHRLDVRDITDLPLFFERHQTCSLRAVPVEHLVDQLEVLGGAASGDLVAEIVQ